jgi:hypothetical protein
MKKFLEELSKSSSYMHNEVPVDTAAERMYQELREKFSSLIGKRALYVSKTEKESRVVVIEEVRKMYIVVSYKYYGMDYQGKMRTSVTYGALICGDDRLDVE